jgi:hypothetical protein
VPDLPNDAGLAKIADHGGLGLQAAMEIDFATQSRSTAGERQELHGEELAGLKGSSYPMP